ncbi:MAG: SAP domain-containing protein [Lachnospiraceae bacterium]|nr:SAP domain-containing protein [Lachnospiraceae bacterium]
MGILDLLFGKKNNVNQPVRVNNGSPAMNKRIPLAASNTGVDIKTLVMLALSEKYRVGEMKYPAYLQNKYGIPFPNEVLSRLASLGYIRKSDGYETLANMSGADLKELCGRFGLKVSGKKEDLCRRLKESVAPVALESQISDRYWIITESGRDLLINNPYIEYYLQDHKYSLEVIGINLTECARICSSGRRVRDALWGELNKRSLEYYQKSMKNRNFHDYCELLRLMALFLEEEGRYEDGLAIYIRYMHYRINFQAALAAINTYSVLRRINEAADTLFIDAEIMPFMAKEIIDLTGECGYDSNQLQSFMVQTLSKETDTGVFNPMELTQFIMFGLNGDKEGQRNMCKKAMQAAKGRMGGK